MDKLITSSSETLRWLSIKSKVEGKEPSLQYNETKYWASFKSFDTNRNIVYLQPQKEQIRLFTRLNSSCDDSLWSTPASEK